MPRDISVADGLAHTQEVAGSNPAPAPILKELGVTEAWRSPKPLIGVQIPEFLQTAIHL